MEESKTVVIHSNSQIASTEGKKAQVTGLIRQLAKRVFEKHETPLSEATEKNLMSYGLRILGTRLSISIHTDDHALIHAVHKHLLKGKNKRSKPSPETVEKLTRFDNLFRHFSLQTAFQQRWSIIYLLYSLAQAQSISNFESFLSPEPISLENLSIQREKPQVENDPPSKPAITFDSSLTHYRLNENVNFETSEQLLLRDLLYVFQGIDGQYIQYNAHLDRYVVDESIGIPVSTRDLITCMSECGWLYRHCCILINKCMEDEKIGLVGQSFCHALQEQLTEYYRLIAVLESQLNSEAIAAEKAARSSLVGSNSEAGSRMTLRRLFVWIQNPLQKIKIMTTVAESAKGLRGGSLSRAVYQHMQHGDSQVREFVHNLMVELSDPIFVMIQRWVLEGELEDPFGEFFIIEHEDVPDEHLWQSKYSISEPMLPALVSPALATRILNIGKSINFMRRCCHDREWVVDISVVGLVEMQGIQFGDTTSIEKVIENAENAANKRLIDLLFHKFHLMVHIKALKKYLLLGQGDFIQALMDSETLNKDSTKTYKHEVVAALESARRSSSAQYEPPEVADRLDVSLEQTRQGLKIWEVFTLDYLLHHKQAFRAEEISPISAIITSDAMNQYGELFRLMWRVKRVEHELSYAWNDHVHCVNRFKIFRIITRLFHQYHLLRHEMIHFVSNVNHYLMFEVLESAWEEFQTHLHSATNMEQLILAHKKYLESIRRKALLEEDSEDVLFALKEVLSTIIYFCERQTVLLRAVADRLMAERMRFEQSIRINTAKGTWGEDGAFELQRLMEERERELAVAAEADISQMAEKYRHQLKLLRDLLIEKSKINSHVRFLTFRLDFNNFYEKTFNPPQDPRQPKQNSPDMQGVTYSRETKSTNAKRTIQSTTQTRTTQKLTPVQHTQMQKAQSFRERPTSRGNVLRSTDETPVFSRRASAPRVLASESMQNSSLASISATSAVTDESIATEQRDPRNLRMQGSGLKRNLPRKFG